MEQEGIIERVDASPWTSNIVTAKKRDGGLRLRVNLSDVHKAVIPDTYPLPTMDELTERIAGSTVFSKVDLLWGYLQLELAEDRRYFTSFVTHEGVYRFRTLPFGLASGSSAFHQVIRKILDGLEGCASILDDILTFGHTVAEHDERLRRVLDRLAKYISSWYSSFDFECEGDPGNPSTSQRETAATVRLHGVVLPQVCSRFRRDLRAAAPAAQSRRCLELVNGLSTQFRVDQEQDCQSADTRSLRCQSFDDRDL